MQISKIPPSSGIFIDILKVNMNFHDLGIDFFKIKL